MMIVEINAEATWFVEYFECAGSGGLVVRYAFAER